MRVGAEERGLREVCRWTPLKASGFGSGCVCLGGGGGGAEGRSTDGHL